MYIKFQAGGVVLLQNVVGQLWNHMREIDYRLSTNDAAKLCWLKEGIIVQRVHTKRHKAILKKNIKCNIYKKKSFSGLVHNVL